MATTKNITMKQFNGTDYDTLYPKTVYNQVSGVAPAGYGLGETSPYIAKTSESGEYDANLISKSCFFAAKTNTPTGDWCYGFHVNRIDSKAFQLMTDELTNNKEFAIRKKNGGTWGPWEWVNPPMQLGVEYRTVERYNGKPVYAKLLNFGALPNSTSKSFAHGISSLGYVVDIYGQGVAGQDVKVSVDTTNITITSTSNLSAVTAYPVIKYTKTTD